MKRGNPKIDALNESKRCRADKHAEYLRDYIHDLINRGWSIRAICSQLNHDKKHTVTGKTTWRPTQVVALLKRLKIGAACTPRGRLEREKREKLEYLEYLLIHGDDDMLAAAGLERTMGPQEAFDHLASQPQYLIVKHNNGCISKIEMHNKYAELNKKFERLAEKEAMEAALCTNTISHDQLVDMMEQIKKLFEADGIDHQFIDTFLLRDKLEKSKS